MITNSLKTLVGGEAGDGVFATSDTMALCFARSGLEVFSTQWYSSRIRGGHIHTRVRVDAKPIASQGDGLDVLLAMDEDTVQRHAASVVPGGLVLYDNSRADMDLSHLVHSDVHVVPVPATKRAKDVLNAPVMKNMILLGALFGVTDFDTDLSAYGSIIRERFRRKGEEVVAKNLEAARLGMQRAKEVLGDGHASGYRLTNVSTPPRMLVTGNEAIALGALAAGCRFIASYPITPATDIIEYLAEKMPTYGGVVVQAEDELCALNMVIGAGFAGVRAMTSSSGPGISLMAEAVGLASMTETPVVIVDVQRVGPSTGMPTRTEQGDLNLLVYGSHGESPRIVLAPSDMEECFFKTVQAFNLAEKYQCPVFVASDQFLSQGKRTHPPFDLKKVVIDRGAVLTEDQLQRLSPFLRYQATESGVSPRSIPGQRGGIYKATGVQHLEDSLATENPKYRAHMMEKMFRKMRAVLQDLDPPQVYGPHDADAAIVSWGSTKGPILEALERLGEEGDEVKLVHITDVWPFHTEAVAAALGSASTVMVIENNFTGQMAGLVRQHLGIDPIRILSYSGDPLSPGRLYREIREIVHVGARMTEKVISISAPLA